MSNSAFGSASYKRALQAARAKDVAGTQHHIHDKHLKEWNEKKSRDQEHPGTSKNGPPNVLSKKKSEAVKHTQKSVSVSVETIPVTKTKETKILDQEAKLKEKYQRIQREKFVNAFTFKCRCDNIGSVGNGL